MALICAASPALLRPAWAEPHWGLRAGTGDGFDAVGVQARWTAPRLAPVLPLAFDARWELALAQWRKAGDAIETIAFGPAAEYPLARSLRLSIGVQPTLLSASVAGGTDVGGRVHFTSHVGARWQPAPRWALELRLQHTSNAGLERINPGIDMTLLGVSYRY